MLTLLFAFSNNAQFERTRVNFECPCTLTSSDGESATLTFGLVNFTDLEFDDLFVTVGIVGQRTASTGDIMDFSGFLGTVEVGSVIAADSTIEPMGVPIELGVIEEGDFYIELLLHSGTRPGESSILDSVWFRDEHEAPFTSLNLADANYLLDTDNDGIADINEELLGTDPVDPSSQPPPPVIDLLILHESFTFEFYNVLPEVFVGHAITATTDMFERSLSAVLFRTVGILGPTDIPEIEGGTELDEATYLELLDEYGADTVLVFRPSSDSLCGFAVEIGGITDKGFLHPNEGRPYTEVFLDPSNCALDVTAHEIGHLMGMGHSYVQLSVGTYPWSRGHGIEGEFGTIMTYAESAYTATAIDTFSNPDLDCHGKPCGVPHTKHNHEKSSNSSLTINITKYQYAARQSPDDDFDFDGDGVGAVSDAFPIDPNEWSDTDGDGFGDNRDAFVDDPLEWVDTDSDGIGNNSDPDIDNDGVPNHLDVDPFNEVLAAPRILSVASEENGDEFGYYSLQVNDSVDDNLGDLVISAPSGRNKDNVQSGKVYVLPLAEFLQPADSDETQSGTNSVSHLLESPHSFVLNGTQDEARVGEHLAQLKHLNGTNELAILSKTDLYLIDLSSERLQELDGLDSEPMDGQIDLTHCNDVVACTRIALNEFEVFSIASVGDLNDDELHEIALLASDSNRSHELVLIVLNRAEIASLASAEETVMTVAELHAQGVNSFMLTMPGGRVFGELKVRNATVESNLQELTFGVIANHSGADGRVYIIRNSQLKKVSEFDEDGDRVVALGDLLSSPEAYRIAGSSRFGHKVSSLRNLGSNNSDGIFVWGSFGRHYLFTDAGYRKIDFEDSMLDGRVELPSPPQSEFGVWRFNVISLGDAPSSSTVLPSIEESSPNLLLTPIDSELLYSEIKELSLLDDPTGEDFNKIVNLPVRIRYPGIYRLRVPFGPNGEESITGISALGDLDQDQKQEFLVCNQSGELHGRFGTCYVVFTSEIEALDMADGDNDHIVMLYETTLDLDGDGITNLLDLDDDGDGLRDSRDRYPHLKEFQYDADGDGYANAVDIYPLDRLEHADLDGDGIGDLYDDDIDGDGLLNDDDPHPKDTDNDGLDNDVDPDDDNDSVLDEDDIFPLNPDESRDTDGDGVGDNGDAFAMDPNEWLDTDLDGIGNNADEDDDNDGYLDVNDAFPLLASEWIDTDGDGVGDNSDAFPMDPLEWEDLDGDGIGDNLGSLTFVSYRLSSGWYEDSVLSILFRSLEVFRLGDMNRDGRDDLEIVNGLSPEHGELTLLTSSADLSSIDELDGRTDYVIDLNTLHNGESSFRITDSSTDGQSLHFTSGSVGDLNADSHQDIVIYQPSATESNSGWFTILFGGDWSAIDGSDGEEDGQIDLKSCLVAEKCLRVTGSEDVRGMGSSGTLIPNQGNSVEFSLAFSSLMSETRGPGRIGSPITQIISDRTLESARASATDGAVVVDELNFSSGDWIFYPEFDGLSPLDEVTFVSRLPDFDEDGIDELVISFPLATTARTYVLGSSDFASMDSADFSADQRINLGSSYRQPNSYRLDGYFSVYPELVTESADEATVGENRSSQMVIREQNVEVGLFVLDASDLAQIERAESESDGVIRSLEANASNTWRFVDAELLLLCPLPESQNRRQLLTIDYESSPEELEISDVRVVVANAHDLSALDNLDGAEDGNVWLNDLPLVEELDSWQIELGSLAEHSILLQIRCAGDFDGDGSEDLAIVLRDFLDDLVRNQIFLIAYADLPNFDMLDREQDRQIDLSILFSTD